MERLKIFLPSIFLPLRCWDVVCLFKDKFSEVRGGRSFGLEGWERPGEGLGLELLDFGGGEGAVKHRDLIQPAFPA